jgi:hypothetical protein
MSKGVVSRRLGLLHDAVAGSGPARAAVADLEVAAAQRQKAERSPYPDDDDPRSGSSVKPKQSPRHWSHEILVPGVNSGPKVS